jgi:hypothetical protein
MEIKVRTYTEVIKSLKMPKVRPAKGLDKCIAQNSTCSVDGELIDCDSCLMNIDNYDKARRA